MIKKLRFALILLALLFCSVNSLKAQQPNDVWEVDGTDIERFGSIAVFAKNGVYSVSKGHHNEDERDPEGRHVLKTIELELQISWKIRKVVENKEDIVVYTLNNDGNFVPVKTIKYGTQVELAPYEYLEEDVQRYKGEPDPNFKISEYLKYAKGAKPAFRVRVQEEFRKFIKNNPDLEKGIKTLAKRYGYGSYELSFFKSVVTKESKNLSDKEQKSNKFLKNVGKKLFWEEIYADPSKETRESKKSSLAKFAVGTITYFGVYYLKTREHFAGNLYDHPASLATFTILLSGWTIAKELMYSKWMATYTNFYDKVKTLGRNTNYFKKITNSFSPRGVKTASELWSMRIMLLQTGLFMLFEKALVGAIDYGASNFTADMTLTWLKGVVILKLLSMTTVLSNAGFGKFVTKGLYGYNKRVIYTRYLDFLAPARDVSVNIYNNQWAGYAYYGVKSIVWAISKMVGYKDYTEFVIAADKAARNYAINGVKNDLTGLADASEWFYSSRNKYGYGLEPLFNEDGTLNRLVVAIDDIDLNDIACAKTSADKFFTLELPESVWKALSRGRTWGEKVNVYTYNGDGNAVAIEYKVNTKWIKLPKEAVDSYVTIFTNVKDIIKEGEIAYAKGLHGAIFAEYAKSDDPDINPQKRANSIITLFNGETSRLNKLLKVKHALSDLDLITLNTMLIDMALDNPTYEKDIKQAIVNLEKELFERGVSVPEFLKDNERTLKDAGTKDGEQISRAFKSYDNFVGKTEKISVNLDKYEEAKKQELTRDAIERFLTLNFGDDAEVLKRIEELKNNETEELLKLSLLAFAKAQVDRFINQDKIDKMEVSFISLLIQPNTPKILEKISGGATEADVETKKIVESAKIFADVLDQVKELRIDKSADAQKFTYDFKDPKVLERLRVENPEVDRAYDIFKSECRSVIEAGRK